MIALHFILEALYFKIYYYEERSKHLMSMGRNPFVYLVAAGIVVTVASYFSWLATSTALRKMGSLILAFMTIAVVAVEHFKQPNIDYYPPMKLEARVHYVIVQSGILIGCLLLFSVGSVRAQPYKKEID